MAQNSVRNCHILIIGGSAGGLDTLIKMLGSVHTHLPFAIVVVLHRANSSESTLTQVLALKTNVPVKEIEDKEKIKPGCIYLVPADYHVLLEKNFTFSLDASEKVNYSRPSIDVTFESAAEVFGKGTFAILLSGGNADGTAGLRAIQNAGGAIFVQDPETAQVSYMPQYAMDHLEVDKVLRPDEMGDFINSLNQKPR